MITVYERVRAEAAITASPSYPLSVKEAVHQYLQTPKVAAMRSLKDRKRILEQGRRQAHWLDAGADRDAVRRAGVARPARASRTTRRGKKLSHGSIKHIRKSIYGLWEYLERTGRTKLDGAGILKRVETPDGELEERERKP